MTAERRRPTPARWLASLPVRWFVALVVAAVLLAAVVVLVANPGHRIGPVRPADPPVGRGPLPTTPG